MVDWSLGFGGLRKCRGFGMKKAFPNSFRRMVDFPEFPDLKWEAGHSEQMDLWDLRPQ
jgi:hypothetical protein